MSADESFGKFGSRVEMSTKIAILQLQQPRARICVVVAANQRVGRAVRDLYDQRFIATRNEHGSRGRAGGGQSVPKWAGRSATICSLTVIHSRGGVGGCSADHRSGCDGSPA